MTRGEIWKDFFKRNVLPAVIALFLFFMFKNIFTEDGCAAVSPLAFAVCSYGLYRMDMT